jgi:hypothetical protein
VLAGLRRFLPQNPVLAPARAAPHCVRLNALFTNAEGELNDVGASNKGRRALDGRRRTVSAAARAL